MIQPLPPDRDELLNGPLSLPLEPPICRFFPLLVDPLPIQFFHLALENVEIGFPQHP